jgi:hypothetical protein
VMSLTLSFRLIALACRRHARLLFSLAAAR